MPSIALALLFFGQGGCTTGVTGSATAPRSDLSHDEALVLAKQVADRVRGRVYVIAPTGSMLPMLDETSVVAVEHVPMERLHRGDIIVYRNAAGAAIIHRLYEQHGSRWYALGDNNASIDRDTVSAENFLGRVCAIFYTANPFPTLGRAVPDAPSSALASRD